MNCIINLAIKAKIKFIIQIMIYFLTNTQDLQKKSSMVPGALKLWHWMVNIVILISQDVPETNIFFS